MASHQITVTSTTHPRLATQAPQKPRSGEGGSLNRDSDVFNSQVVRNELVRIKEGGAFASWIWRVKRLVLKEQTLTIYKSTSAAQQTVIPLSDISNIERIDLKPYCLLLETKGKRYHILFKSDEELYDWQDDIYSRSPLSCVSNPTNFVHNVHIGFDPVSGAFTDMPEQWSELLAKSATIQADYSKDPQIALGKLGYHGDQKLGLDDMGGSSSTRTGVTPKCNSEALCNLRTVRNGLVSIKEGRKFVCRTWKLKWLVLKEQTLTIHKSASGSQQTVIFLRHISNIERTDLQPYCLLLETKGKQYYLSLKSDEELYSWLDDIYSRSPLNGVSNPTNFVHNVHVGFDPVSGAFTGMPNQWNGLIAPEDCAKHPQAGLDALESCTHLHKQGME